MKSLSAVLLGLAACGSALAQTPATNPMPDGSHDMYVGIGVQTASRYEGAPDRRTKLLVPLQVQWSNGVFISGGALGMHLSTQPGWEYGPMLALINGRGQAGILGMPVDNGTLVGPPIGTSGIIGGSSGTKTNTAVASGHHLDGMPDVPMRVAAGGFANLYLAPHLRWNNSVVVGSGQNHHGLRWDSDLQWLVLSDIGSRHSLSVQAGISAANQSDMQSYFGVDAAAARASSNPVYAADGGLKDVHLGLRWNWKLSPSWMLSTQARIGRLQGSAADSPLVERATTMSVGTAIAYRF